MGKNRNLGSQRYFYFAQRAGGSRAGQPGIGRNFLFGQPEKNDKKRRERKPELTERFKSSKSPFAGWKLLEKGGFFCRIVCFSIKFPEMFVWGFLLYYLTEKRDSYIIGISYANLRGLLKRSSGRADFACKGICTRVGS